jgi:hypothetical protein
MRNKSIRKTQFNVVSIVLGVACLGILVYGLSKATTSFASLEPELASVNSPAKIGIDATASGGRSVAFGGSPVGFSFTAAGDHGYGTESRNSMDAVARSGSEFYLALGDLSYSSGSEDEWCATFKSKFNDVELLAGNHDTGESSGGNIDLYRRYCPFTLGTLTGDYGKQYHFDYPGQNPAARFIMIAPAIRGSMGIDYSTSGAGYAFTQKAIDEARAKGIKWIIVGMHKNCISVGAKSCEIGTDIMNLLINKRVDVVLQSHDHNYQRSHALKCITTMSTNNACIADNGSDGQYAKGSGPVIIINGEFGRNLYAVNGADAEAGYFAKMDSTTFGITRYTIDMNGLSAQYLRSGGGSFADSFTIR